MRQGKVQCTKNRGRVSPLKSYINSLPQVHSGTHLLRYSDNSSTEFWYKCNGLEPQAPKVSTAMGTKVWATRRAVYFADFRTSASNAADPVAREDLWICDEASISGHLKSQSKHLPHAHGTRVRSSGLLPSSCNRLVGSRQPLLKYVTILLDSELLYFLSYSRVKYKSCTHSKLG